MSLFVDIAIGVPFAGKDQRGKVLIYNGDQNGLHRKPSQVLQGVWTSQTVPSGFGFSLRGDADVDKNDYPGKIFFLSHVRACFLARVHSLEHASCVSTSLSHTQKKVKFNMVQGFLNFFLYYSKVTFTSI
jgi:hypothetical protein